MILRVARTMRAALRRMTAVAGRRNGEMALSPSSAAAAMASGRARSSPLPPATMTSPPFKRDSIHAECSAASDFVATTSAVPSQAL